MTAQSASAKEIHVFFSPRITRMTRILHSSLFMSEDKNRLAKLQSGCIKHGYLQCPSAIIVLTKAPLKGAMSHQPRATPWGIWGNITNGALTGQKRYRREEDAYAPPGRNLHTAYNPQGGALGYMIVGLSGRRSTGVL